ncbi:MAG: PAS domain S-box protein, partial [Chloroflexales bacterium]
MKKSAQRERRFLVILELIFVLLAIGIASTGYLSFRATAILLSLLIAVVSARLVLIWRQQSRRYDRRQEQTAAALLESETRFHTMFEEHGAVMLLIEPQGGIIFDANRSAVSFYGYPKSALCAMSINQINMLSPEQVAAERQRALHEERNYFVFPHRLASGAERIVEVYSSPISVRETQVLFSIIHDITERKHAEIALRLSEELYRRLMESMDSAVHTMDYDGRFLFINGVAARQLGGAPSDFIDKTMHDLFPEPAASRQLERLREVIDQDHEVTSEWRGLVNGQLRWYRSSLHPIHDETGRATCVLVNSTDIHDLKAAQQELLELNHTLEERVMQRTAEVQDLYENAPNGYHSLDADGKIAMVNQTELAWLGYSRDELIGRPFTDLITAQSRSVFQESYPLFKQRGWVRGVEYEIIRKNGTTFDVLLDATAIYDEHGRYVMSRSTMFNNTERKKAEETLRQANAELARAARTKDEFLANMSHELRTPLNAILGLSEALQEEFSGPLNPRQHDFLQSIESSGRHLLTLINDILDISKVEAGRLGIEIEPMPVADICQASMVFVKDLALRKAIRLALYINDQTAEVAADPKRLKQMLVNLLSNAVKFTPA